MKVIDLLNKIANGEEVPLKIKFDGEVYIYNFEIKDYEYENKCGWLMDVSRNNGNEFLNDEVEIIEEEKEIKKIDFKTAETQKEKNRIMKDKINELIDIVKDLKKEVKDEEI